MADETGPDNSDTPAFGPNYFTELKKQAWQALGSDQPSPDMDAMAREISPTEIYYLLQRWATLAIFDVYNLEPAGEKVLLSLPGSSPHYNIYDCGSCIIGAPKDLFSHARTLQDALMTAGAMADEVHKRGWTVEFAGFNKMARKAWVELQLQGSKTGRFIEVLHYKPSSSDQLLAQSEVTYKGPSI